MQEIIHQLEEKRAAARMGGGEKRIAAQHSKGKLTARERLEVLLDEGTVEECRGLAHFDRASGQECAYHHFLGTSGRGDRQEGRRH